MNIPVPPSIQLPEEAPPANKSTPSQTGAASLLDSKTVGVLSSILGKSKSPAPVNESKKNPAPVVESKYVDPKTATALTSILSKAKPIVETAAPVAEVLGGKVGVIDPVFTKMETAVSDYLGTGQFSMEAYPDPKVEGSWAIKVVRIPKDDRPIFFLIRGGDPIDAEHLEEVEFRSWPPTYSGGRSMRESDVKNWITSKINAALISLGVPQEKHGEVEDAVFTAALAGKLGNGLPSDETAQAIANMVTELAGTAAAPTPAVVAPEAPEAPEASVTVGKEAGLAKPVEVEKPAPEVGPAQGDKTLAIDGEPELVVKDAGPISMAELEKLASELDEPAAPEVEPEEMGDREVPEEPELSTPEDIEAEVEKMADEMRDGEEPEGIAAEKGVSEKDVDSDELKMGIEVEQEHTDDVDKARKIALDHLAEFPKYYTELKKMEKKLGKSSAKKESIGGLKTEEDVMEAIDSMVEDELSETLHGLRNKERIQHGSITLVADTTSDPEWVYLYREDGTPVARQQKTAGGRVFSQGTNPDYTGFITFPLQVWRQYGADPAEWHYYDRHAKKGDILYQIDRLVESLAESLNDVSRLARDLGYADVKYFGRDDLDNPQSYSCFALLSGEPSTAGDIVMTARSLSEVEAYLKNKQRVGTSTLYLQRGEATNEEDITTLIDEMVEEEEITEKVEKRGNKWCTVHCHGAKKGQIIHCFDTKEKALAQHRAIQMSKYEGADINESVDFASDEFKFLDWDIGELKGAGVDLDNEQAVINKIDAWHESYTRGVHVARRIKALGKERVADIPVQKPHTPLRGNRYDRWIANHPEDDPSSPDYKFRFNEGVDIQKYPEVGYHTIDASGHVVRGTLTQNKTANTQLYHAGYDAWYSTKEDAGKATKRIRGPKRFWSDGTRWSITDSIDEARTEVGVTRFSLENAKELVAKYGRPFRVELKWVGEGPDWGYYTTAMWKDGKKHTFTGFAWGYGGEGPRGLKEFFKMIGVEGIDIGAIPNKGKSHTQLIEVPEEGEKKSESVEESIRKKWFAALPRSEVDITAWYKGKIVSGGIDSPYTRVYGSEAAAEQKALDLVDGEDVDKVTITDRETGDILFRVTRSVGTSEAIDEAVTEDDIVKYVQDHARYARVMGQDSYVAVWKGKRYVSNDTRDLVLQIAKDEGLKITEALNEATLHLHVGGVDDEEIQDIVSHVARVVGADKGGEVAAEVPPDNADEAITERKTVRDFISMIKSMFHVTAEIIGREIKIHANTVRKVRDIAQYLTAVDVPYDVTDAGAEHYFLINRTDLRQRLAFESLEDGKANIKRIAKKTPEMWKHVKHYQPGESVLVTIDGVLTEGVVNDVRESEVDVEVEGVLYSIPLDQAEHLEIAESTVEKLFNGVDPIEVIDELVIEDVRRELQ